MPHCEAKSLKHGALSDSTSRRESVARLRPNTPLQLTNAPTIVVHSWFRQVRSQLNARTLDGHMSWWPGGSVRWYQIPCAAIGIALLPSCHNPHHAAILPAAPCATPVAGRGDWKLIDRGDFAFELPPRFRRPAGPGGGIDSWVESYPSKDGRQTVSFEYGQWSNDLRPDSDEYSDFAACKDSIGGRPATVATLRIHDPKHKVRDGLYIAAAAWRSPVSPREHLTIWTETRDAKSLNVLLTVLRTVKFRERQGTAK